MALVTFLNELILDFVKKTISFFFENKCLIKLSLIYYWVEDIFL